MAARATNVPIIFSSDFLEIYNVFAPSQDLPQLSEKTISSVNIILECTVQQEYKILEEI